MKFREIILTIMAIAVMMVFSDKTMAAPSVPATGITLPTEISVAPGNSKQLKATLIPSDSTSAITWKSWDESVVKVNAAGVISGVKKGAAYVMILLYWTWISQNIPMPSCVEMYPIKKSHAFLRRNI